MFEMIKKLVTSMVIHVWLLVTFRHSGHGLPKSWASLLVLSVAQASMMTFITGFASVWYFSSFLLIPLGLAAFTSARLASAMVLIDMAYGPFRLLFGLNFPVLHVAFFCFEMAAMINIIQFISALERDERSKKAIRAALNKKEGNIE